MTTTPNREAWLNNAVAALRPMFAEIDVELPTAKVSCGFPGGGSARSRIGECWATAASSDGVAQVFVSPLLDQPVDVLATLLHELVHVADDCEHGHKAPFARIAKKLGLEGKMTSTHAGEALTAKLAEVADSLGAYPHAAISLGESMTKKQITRMLKLECPEDGYTVRTTAKWLAIGMPTCPCGTLMEPAN